MYIPLNYEQLNIIESSYQPSAVKAYNNATFAYWERSLFQRACSVLDFTLPKEWEGKIRDFFYYCLYRFGYVAVFERPDMGRVFNPCSLTGRNFWYQPTKALIANPSIPESLELEIGTECEILKLTPDYIGIWPIIQYYAEKLSTLDSAINMSLINNKFAFMLAARNKAAAQALKKMLDKVNRGEPAVIVDMKVLNDPDDKDVPWQVWDRPHLKDSYLTTDQLRDFQTIINNFDAEIGIPTIPYQKKERMVTSEAESREIDAAARLEVWLDTLEGSIKEVKKLYPDITLSVKYRYADSDEGKEKDDDNGDNDTSWTL